MTQLTTIGGEYYKIDDDGGIQQLSEGEYRRELIMRQGVESQSALTQGMTTAGGYFRDTLSGFRELTGLGDPAEEQALRAETSQALAPHRDYGGTAGDVGGFLAPAATALLPGGLKTQMAIGAGQMASEQPETPLRGAAEGAAYTFLGDWVGDVVGRIGSRMVAKRAEVSPSIRAAEEQGIEFTPGQRTGDVQRRLMEMELAKNPLFAGIDAPRFLRNQARLNDLAAGFLGVAPGGGRLTGEMLGEAYDKAKAGFKALDNYDGQIAINPDDLVNTWDELTPPARELMENFANRYRNVLDGPVSGKEFNQARNWLAEQSRKPANHKLGIADEIQSIIGVLDEGAVNSVDEITAAGLDRARGQWKSMLVIEGAQRSARSKAGGDILPASAYASLEKYYGRRFRHGRIRDPFMDAVRGLTEAQEGMPPVRPSGNAPMQVNPFTFLQQRLYQEPLARSYMEGGRLSEILLGASLMDNAVPGAGQLGIGAARGIMAEDELE